MTTHPTSTTTSVTWGPVVALMAEREHRSS